MIKSLVAKYVSLYLEEYVHLSRDQFQQLSLWSGDVVLKNLELKQVPLHSIQLPFEIKSGFISQLKLSLPWRKLDSEVVKVSIDELFVLLGPNWNPKYVPEEEERRARKRKQKKLEQLNSSAANENSLEVRLITKIVDNLQFEVNNIHIRYEHMIENQAISFGITICRLFSESTDSSWKPSFLDSQAELLHKKLEIDDLAIYCNKEKELWHKQSWTNEQLHAKFSSMIPTKSKLLSHDFILSPIQASAKLILNKNPIPEIGRPRVILTIDLDEVTLNLDDFQYMVFVNFTKGFSRFQRSLQYRKFKPTQFVNPKSRWLFAYNCITSEIREKKRVYTKEFIEQRRKDRLEYIKIYKLNKEKPSKESKKRLDQLEDVLKFEDIVYFRNLAEIEIKKESTSKSFFNQNNPKKAKTFFSSWFSAETEKDPETPQLIKMLSPEQRKELENSLKADTENLVVSHSTMSEQYVRSIVNFFMKTGTFILKQKREKLIEVVFNEFSVNYQEQPAARNKNWSISLQKFIAFDHWTKSNPFPEFIQPRTKDTFLKVNFEINPLNSGKSFPIDYSFFLKMAPQDFVYNDKLISLIFKFFSKPKNTSFEELPAVAQHQIKSFRKSTQLQLELGVAEHKKVDLNVDIKAPRILIPQCLLTSGGSSLLMADLGHLIVRTDLKDSQISKEENTKIDPYDIYYDHFRFTATGLNLCFLDSVLQFRQFDQLSSIQKTKKQLIKSFDINTNLFLCIFPEDITLTKTKFSGSLPFLQFELSLAQFTTLSKMIDDILPKSQLDQNAANYNTSVDLSQSEQLPVIILDDNRLTPQNLLARILADASFSIGEIFVVLKQLSNIEAKGIQASFLERTYDRSLRLVLTSFGVYELNRSSKDKNNDSTLSTREPLIYSADPNNSLIEFLLEEVQPNSPEFKSKYYHKLNVTFTFKTLNVNLKKEAILLFNEFIYAGLNELTILKLNEQAKLAQSSSHVSKEVQPISTDIYIEIYLESLTLILFHGLEARFALIRVSNITGKFTLQSLSTSEGSLENFLVQDLTRNEAITIFSVAPVEKKLITFKFGIFEKKSEMDFDSYLDMEMAEVQFTILQKFLSELYVWIDEFEGMRNFIREGAEKAMESDHKVKMNIVLDHPNIFFPKFAGSEDHLLADLGRIVVFSEPSLPDQDHIKIEIQKGKLSSHHQDSSQDGIIIDNFSFLFELFRNGQAPPEVPKSRISASIPEIAVILSETQYILIRAMMDQNIGEQISPSRLVSKDEASKTNISKSKSTEGSLVEVNFDIPSFSLTLTKKLVPGGKNEDLIIAYINNYKFQLIYLENELRVNAILEKLSVIDYLCTEELPSSFKHLVSSHSEGENTSGNELVSLVYISRNSKSSSPSFDIKEVEPQYEAFVILNRLSIQLNQRTTLNLAHYFSSYEPSPTIVPKTEVVTSTEITSVPRTRYNFNMHELSFFLNSNIHQLAQIDITDLTLTFNMFGHYSEMEGFLNNIKVTDLFSMGIHDTIFSTTRKDPLITFKWSSHVPKEGKTEEIKENLPISNSLLNLEMGEVEFVFVNVFISYLMDWMDDLKTTQELSRYLEGSKKTTVSSKSILLVDLTINHPRIIVPKNIYSHELLSANLGKIRIKNSMEGSHFSVTVDAMNLYSAICTTEYPTNIVNMEPVLHDISFSLIINHYTKKVDQITTYFSKLELELPKLILSLSQAQYALLWEVFEENISQQKPWQCPNCSFSNPIYVKICASCNTNKPTIKDWYCPRCSFKNSGNITICLLCSEHKKEHSTNIVVTPDERTEWDMQLSVSGTFEIFETSKNRCRTSSIAIFSFNSAKISLMSSFEKLQINSVIGSIRLTEKFLPENVFRDLLFAFEINNEPPIRFSYLFEKDEQKTDIVIQSPKGVIIWKVMEKIRTFFTTYKAYSSQFETEIVKPLEIITNVNVKLHDGQLFLPAHLQRRDSKAVLLRFEEIVSSFYSRKSEYKLLINWNNIEVQLCRMDSESKKYRIPVIDGFKAEMANIIGFQKDESKVTNKWNLTVLDPIQMQFAYEHYHIYKLIVSSFSDVDPTIKKEETKKEKVIDYNKAAQIEPREEVKYAVAEQFESHILKQGFHVFGAEHFSFDAQMIRIVFINDLKGRNVPLMEFVFPNVNFQIENWSSNLSGDISDFIVTSNFFNNKLSQWEPMILKWQLSVHIQKSLNPVQTRVSIVSPQNLDIQITHEAIRSLLDLQEALNSKKERDFSRRPPPYILRNQFEELITIYMPNKELVVKPNDEVHLDLQKYSVSKPKVEQEDPDVISIRIFEDITRIRIDVVDKSFFFIKTNGKTISLLCDVSLLETGTKLIRIGTATEIENESPIPVKILVQTSPSEWKEFGPIAPKQIFSLPLYATYGSFKLTPADLGYTWSKPVTYTTFARINSITCALNGSSFFTFQVKEIPKILNGVLYTIFKLLPAMTIENLTFTSLTYQLLDKKKRVVREGALLKGNSHPILEVDTNSELSLRIGIPDISSELSTIKTLFTKGESVIPLNEQIPIQLSKFLILYLLKDQTNKFSIFPKYWIRDKTYLILSLKQQAIELPVKSLYIHSPLVQIGIYGNPMWSQELNLDQISSEVIFIEDNKTTFSLAVEASTRSGKFFRTRIITVSSHYVFVNTTKDKLNFRQTTSKIFFPLLPNAPTPFHWSAGKKEITITKEGPYQWSGPFHIDESGVFPLKIRHNKDETEEIIQVKVQTVGSTIYVVIATSLEIPPYIIENHSNESICFHQSYGGTMKCLAPQSKIPFSWDIPAGVQTLILRDPNTLRDKNQFYEIDLNKDGYSLPMLINNQKLVACVITNGPSSVLKIVPASQTSLKNSNKDEYAVVEIYENQRRLMLGPYSAQNLMVPDRDAWTDCDGRRINKNDFKLPDKSWRWAMGWVVDLQSPNRDTEGWEYAFSFPGPWSPSPSNFGSWVRRRRWTKTRIKKPLEEVDQSLTLKLDFKGEIGILLIDNKLQSVAYFGAQKVSINYFQSKFSTMFDLTVDYFQLDDQRSNAQFPVVISPTTKNSNTPALTLKLATRNDPTCVTIENAKVHVQPLDIELDEKFAKVLSDFISDDSPRGEEIEEDEEENEIAIVSELRTDAYFFRELEISPIKVNLSLTVAPTETEDTFSLPGSLRFFFNYAISIRNSSFSLASMRLQHSLHSRESLILTMSRFYQGEIKGKVVKMFLSSLVAPALFTSQKKRRLRPITEDSKRISSSDLSKK